MQCCRRFVQDFSKIAAPLTLTLETSSPSSESQSSKTADGVNDEIVGDENGNGGASFSSKSSKV